MKSALHILTICLVSISCSIELKRNPDSKQTAEYSGYSFKEHQTSFSERSELTKCGYSTPENAEQFAVGILLPWMKDFLLYDPCTDLKRVQGPNLCLIGSKDQQVAVGENVDAIRQIFDQNRNRNTVVIKLPGLKHMLQVVSTGSPFEHKVIGESISPLALEIISNWILTFIY